MAMVVGAQDPCAGAGQAVVDDAVIDYPPGADTYAANNCIMSPTLKLLPSSTAIVVSPTEAADESLATDELDICS